MTTSTGIDYRKAMRARDMNPNDYDLDLMIRWGNHFSDQPLEETLDTFEGYTREEILETLDHPEFDNFPE